jgi:hypothetical protein
MYSHSPASGSDEDTIIFLTYIHGYNLSYDRHCCVSVLLLIRVAGIISVINPTVSPNHAIAHFA